MRQGIDESSRGTGYFRFSVMRDQLVLAQRVYCEILGNFVSRFLNFGNLKSAMGVWVWDMYAMELGKSYKSEFCFLSWEPIYQHSFGNVGWRKSVGKNNFWTETWIYWINYANMMEMDTPGRVEMWVQRLWDRNELKR